MVVFFTHFNKRLTQCEKKKAALSFMDDNFDDNWEEEDQVNPDDSLYVNLGNNIDSEDYPSKKVISIATPEQIDSMVDRFKKKRAVKNQHSQGGTLTRNGNYVSNFAPIKEMEIKSRERKDMQRTNNRIEFKHVADFVHLFLIKKLEFS